MGIVVADTSVLINFLKIDRMDLIGRHSDGFIATDHVGSEITDRYPEQRVRYAAALSHNHLKEQRVEDIREVRLFLRLAESPRLGRGECSAIAVALSRGYRIAIDDVRAITRALREAGLAGTTLRIMRTQDIMVDLIRAGVLDLTLADAILTDWATVHQFRLSITTFRSVL